MRKCPPSEETMGRDRVGTITLQAMQSLPMLSPMGSHHHFFMAHGPSQYHLSLDLLPLQGGSSFESGVEHPLASLSTAWPRSREREISSTVLSALPTAMYKALGLTLPGEACSDPHPLPGPPGASSMKAVLSTHEFRANVDARWST